MLYEKYAPYTLGGIAGNKAAIDSLIAFTSAINSDAHPRPILIFGPSGTGKTTAAHAIAYSGGFETIELNASDYRDAETLNKLILPASNTRGLFNKKVLIILDEVDELSSRFDSGAERVITQLLKSSRQPVVLIANDFWDRKISFIRNYVEKVEFKKIGRDDMLRLLKSIADREGKVIGTDVLEEITARSNGDMRGAINDLELLLGAKEELLENLGIRDRKMEVFATLDKIFLTGDFDSSRNAMLNSGLDLEMMINWVDENIPNRYILKSSIRDSYMQLSKASMFLNKASRNNYYGYMRYASILTSSGVSLAGRGRVTLLKQYAFPSTIRYLSKTKKDRGSLNNIASKLMPILHTNKRSIINDFLPVLRIMISKANKVYGEEHTTEFLERRFNLGKDEIEDLSNAYGLP
ncbi:replication factor C large subunit [Candidatus Marsarchaeota archaeon]|nr:replication factor C large subunit [Candidatus Marsarchaeota archaeon]